MPEPKPDNNQTILPTRRQFIAKSAVVGAGAVIASTQVSDAYFFRNSAPIDLEGLPSSWVRSQGSNLQNYARYIQSLDLKMVSVQQVISAHARRKGNVWNTLPPRSMWRGMGRTLKVADQVAKTLGQPVKKVTSAYRSPQYNRCCPGAKSKSYHMRNVALDLQFRTSPSRVAAAARYLREKGYFKGGIGRYNSFTHIDTRGTNVNW